MLNKFMFSDEAGCFTFSRQQNVSKYFIICTVTMPNCDIGTSLLNPRRKLIWEGHELGDYFHATTDKQSVRDAVFSEILTHKFKVQATICEKSKAQPQVKTSRARFYQYPWYYHMKHGISGHLNKGDLFHVTAASIGNKKEKDTYLNAISDVMNQNLENVEWKVDFRSAASDPCLQVADYCAWAIQRKWELGREVAYKQIESRITYEYELWKFGTKHYY